MCDHGSLSLVDAAGESKGCCNVVISYGKECPADGDDSDKDSSGKDSSGEDSSGKDSSGKDSSGEDSDSSSDDGGDLEC